MASPSSPSSSAASATSSAAAAAAAGAVGVVVASANPGGLGHAERRAAEVATAPAAVPLRCPWRPDMSAEERARDPHPHSAPAPRPRILASALDAIGNTPLIRINKIAEEEGVECEIVAKCEFYNAGACVDAAAAAAAARAKPRPANNTPAE